MDGNIQVLADAARDIGEALHVLLGGVDELDRVLRGLGITAVCTWLACAAMKAAAIEATSTYEAIAAALAAKGSIRP